ncbi:MAG TPA: TIGR03435 family protein, partial [Bryobacteraceae bacterium]|nr:TIGR03435 family protein [Bryobacteraceae bacterium]
QTLMSLIQWAYVNFANDRFDPLGSVPISGGPPWIRADLFTIDAKTERPQSWGTMNGLMLRGLLEQRFKLKIHTEKRVMPVYALTAAKGGAKLQASKRDCVVLDPEHPPLPVQLGKPLPAVCGMGRLNSQGWEAFAVTMGELARLLSDNADRKVVDRTGISGTYDIHLNLSPEDLGISSGAAANAEPADVFARVRASVHKLGLNLTSSRAPEDVLVIDTAERPSGN